MFAKLLQIFNPKNKDLQKRILFTFGALFVFKLGIAIIVPGIDQNALGTRNLGFLELINAMGGGAMERFSIFSLGVMPYITASIVMQLLEMDIVPYIADLAKQGQTGRQKINEITRYVGIALAFIQGYMFSFTYLQGASVFQYVQFAVILTAGTAFLLWLGDQITAKGFGNGISMLIMAGIIANMPVMFSSAWAGITASSSGIMGILAFSLYVLVYFGVVIGVVYVQLAERRIQIQYANRSSSVLGKQNYIPFKLNSAGVVPVIFASSLVSTPALVADFMKNESFSAFINNWLSLSSSTGFVLYVVLIVVFSYFYTFLQIKPKELSENLQKNGGFIPAIRPGKETNEYLKTVLNRITIVGALFLAFLAGLPIVFGLFSTLPASVTVGGTSLLIVVGVALESYKQLEGKLLNTTYTKERRKRK
jgi:preprotein translocase subunit SecY